MLETTGKYGIQRLNFLKNHRPEFYNQLLINGELANHLININTKSTINVQEVLSQLLKSNPPPDKTQYPEKWTQHMNILKHQAEEIVCNTLIYA